MKTILLPHYSVHPHYGTSSILIYQSILFSFINYSENTIKSTEESGKKETKVVSLVNTVTMKVEVNTGDSFAHFVYFGGTGQAG